VGCERSPGCQRRPLQEQADAGQPLARVIRLLHRDLGHIGPMLHTQSYNELVPNGLVGLQVTARNGPRGDATSLCTSSRSATLRCILRRRQEGASCGPRCACAALVSGLCPLKKPRLAGEQGALGVQGQGPPCSKRARCHPWTSRAPIPLGRWVVSGCAGPALRGHTPRWCHPGAGRSASSTGEYKHRDGTDKVEYMS
jgi:hypothetical protein